MTQAFVYRWTHLSTGKWYIGSRTSKGCHPNDGYICSSKIVKPLIQANPEEWRRDILAMGSAIDMRKLETELLINANAAQNPQSYNQSNGSIKFSRSRKSHTAEAKRKIGLASKNRPPNRKGQKQPKEAIEKMIATRKALGIPGGMLGKTHSEETKQKISQSTKGKPKSEIIKQRMRDSRLNRSK